MFHNFKEHKLLTFRLLIIIKDQLYRYESVLKVEITVPKISVIELTLIKKAGVD